MAQINSPKSFDKQLLSSDVLKGIEPLVDYINQGNDQVTRALTNQLTLPENLRGEVRDLSVYHGVPISVTPKQSVANVIVLGCSGGDVVTGFSKSQTSDGLLSLTFYFRSAIPLLSRSVTYSAPFATYEVKGAAGISVGDKVSFSGHRNSSYNGSFSVQFINDAKTSISVHSPDITSALTETTYVGSSESAKTVTLFLFFT
jgi:hypothetical protein